MAKKQISRDVPEPDQNELIEPKKEPVKKEPVFQKVFYRMIPIDTGMGVDFKRDKNGKFIKPDPLKFQADLVDEGKTKKSVKLIKIDQGTANLLNAQCFNTGVFYKLK